MRKPAIQDKLSLLIYVLYLIIGIGAAGDIGVNWDDSDQRTNGLNNIQYLAGNKEPIRQSLDRYHGPAFEMLLIGAEKITGAQDAHSIYLIRHRAVFLFFALCVIAFYFLVRRLFVHPWLPLAGCLMLVLHPRIFADSMYNPKDITVLGAMIVGTLTLILLSERLSWPYMLLHAFMSAFAIDIRVIALLLPIATIGILLYRNLYIEKAGAVKVGWILLAYLTCTLLWMIPMWPILIDAPFHHVGQAIAQMSNYTAWNYDNLYFGKLYPGTQTPGQYQFVWFLLTTPVIYSLIFLLSVPLLLWHTLRSGIYRHIYILLALGIFLAPPIAMWIRYSVVLEGWRHVFFIYPFFVLVCLYGISMALASSSVLTRRALPLILGCCFIFNAGMIAYLHPFEYTYFNPLANSLLAPMDRKFEIDYWGPSCRQGLEYILRDCYSGTPVKVAVSERPGKFNYNFLSSSDQAKIELVSSIDSADYYLSFHRWDPHPMPDGKIACQYKRQGNRIVTVYRLK